MGSVLQAALQSSNYMLACFSLGCQRRRMGKKNFLSTVCMIKEVKKVMELWSILVTGPKDALKGDS